MDNSSTANSGLRCCQCAFVTLSAKVLMGHILKEHHKVPGRTEAFASTPACEARRSQSFKCHFCGSAKETQKGLDGHMLRHTILDKFKCSHCNYWSSSSQIVSQHEKKCHEQPSEEERDHNLTIDGIENSRFEGLFCRAPSPIEDLEALPLLEPFSAIPLRTDELSFEDPPTLQMEVSPPLTIPYTGNKPEKSHSGRGLLEKAPGKAKRKSILKKRERVEDLNRPYRCKLCLFSGKTEDSLARHVTVHEKRRGAGDPIKRRSPTLQKSSAEKSTKSFVKVRSGVIFVKSLIYPAKQLLESGSQRTNKVPTRATKRTLHRPRAAQRTLRSECKSIRNFVPAEMDVHQSKSSPPKSKGLESGTEHDEGDDFTLTDKQIDHSVKAIPTRASTLECNICPFNCTDPRSRKSHMYGHETVQLLKCSYCPWWSNLKSSILRHENKWHNARHTPTPPTKRFKACPEPSASVPDVATSTERSEHATSTAVSPNLGIRSRFPCGHCNFTAGNMETLLDHMRDHDQEEEQGVMGDRKRKRPHSQEHFCVDFEKDGDPLAVAPENPDDSESATNNKEEENDETESGWKIVSVTSLAASTKPDETRKVGVSRSESPGPFARDPPSSVVHSNNYKNNDPIAAFTTSTSSFGISGSSNTVRSSSAPETLDSPNNVYVVKLGSSVDPLKLREIPTGIDEKHCPIGKFVGSSPVGLSRRSFRSSFCPYWGSSKHLIIKNESDFHDVKPFGQYQRFRGSNNNDTEFDDGKVLSPSEIITKAKLNYDPMEVSHMDIGQHQYTNSEENQTLKGSAETQFTEWGSYPSNLSASIPIGSLLTKVGPHDLTPLLNNTSPVILPASQPHQPLMYQAASAGSGEQAGREDSPSTIPTVNNFPSMMNVVFNTSSNFTICPYSSAPTQEYKYECATDFI